MKSDKICNIDIEKEESWKSNAFFTFDVDWASDEVFNETLDLLDSYNASATFFCTHETKVLERLRAGDRYEIGVHPNFNFLLEGNFRYGSNYKEVLKYYKAIVPESVSVRSHSLTQQSNLLDEFGNQGLRFEFNLLIPMEAGYLKPFKYNDIVRVPYMWEDDVHCMFNWEYDVSRFLSHKGIKVFDFHPIHVFLNTENLDRYNSAKPYLRNYNDLKKYVNHDQYGTRDFLIEILEKIK